MDHVHITSSSYSLKVAEFIFTGVLVNDLQV